MRFTFILAASILAPMVSTHPGHDIDAEIAEREAALKYTPRNLDHCAAKLKARGLEDRAIQRRANKAKSLIQTRGLKTRRSIDSVLATDHNQTLNGYTAADDPATTFFASNGSCTPFTSGESGPYSECPVWAAQRTMQDMNPILTKPSRITDVAGEYIRSNLTEDQEGVPVHYDSQVINVANCEPIEGAYFEIFNANSTAAVYYEGGGVELS